MALVGTIVFFSECVSGCYNFVPAYQPDCQVAEHFGISSAACVFAVFVCNNYACVFCPLVMSEAVKYLI